MWLEDWQLSATMKVIAWAAIGTAGKFLLDGEFTWRGLRLAVAGFLFTAAFVVMALEFVPALTNASENVRLAFALSMGYIAPSIIGRIEGARFAAKMAGVEIESNGKENGNQSKHD
jgi:hypothetical protein